MAYWSRISKPFHHVLYPPLHVAVVFYILLLQSIDITQRGYTLLYRGGDWDSVPILVAAMLAMKDSSLQTRLTSPRFGSRLSVLFTVGHRLRSRCKAEDDIQVGTRRIGFLQVVFQ